jgi:hypothetical protein
LRRILVDLVPHGSDRNSENLGGPRAVPAELGERAEDEFALDLLHCVTDEAANECCQPLRVCRGLRWQALGRRGELKSRHSHLPITLAVRYGRIENDSPYDKAGLIWLTIF